MGFMKCHKMTKTPGWIARKDPSYLQKALKVTEIYNTKQISSSQQHLSIVFLPL